MSWSKRFPADFDVPDAVVELTNSGVAHDVSDGNAVCPCFAGDLDDGTVRLWVDHPDRDRRESHGDHDCRYFVESQYSPTGRLMEEGDWRSIYEGDDLKLAIHSYLDALAEADCTCDQACFHYDSGTRHSRCEACTAQEILDSEACWEHVRSRPSEAELEHGCTFAEDWSKQRRARLLGEEE